MRELEQQRRSRRNHHTNQQTAKEYEHEDADALQEAQEPHLRLLALLVPLRRLKDDDGDGIVQDRLAKDDGVQLGVDLVGREDGEDGHGVGGGERGADGDGIDEGESHGAREKREEEEEEADDDGGEEGAGKGESEDDADVAEEVGLVELVARGQNDGW